MSWRYFYRGPSIRKNKSELGSRGWAIRRRGTIVYKAYGAVQVRPVRRGNRGSATEFYWADFAPWPIEEEYEFESTDDAKEFVAEEIDKQVKQGYFQFPKGVRIED